MSVNDIDREESRCAAALLTEVERTLGCRHTGCLRLGCPDCGFGGDE